MRGNGLNSSGGGRSSTGWKWNLDSKSSAKLCRCPFLRLDGGRGGGGGGIRQDSSVLGERVGGAGGGANRPAAALLGTAGGRLVGALQG